MVRRPLGALVLALLLAGCGTTVPLAQQQGTAGAPAGLQTTTSTDTTGTVTGSPSGQLGTAGAGRPTAAGSPTRAGAGAPDAGRPAVGRAGSPAGAGQNGPGVTADSVSFGFIYQKNAADQQAALGNTATASNRPNDVLDALAADVNKHGGVGGRKLKMAYYAYEVTPTATADGLSQEFCDHFTRDVKVLVVAQFSTPTLIECLRRAGVLATSGGLAGTDNDYRRYSNYYDTGSGTLDQVQRNLVDALVAQGYFTNWNTATGTAGGTVKPKLGVLAPEDPGQPGYKETVQKTLLPELARRGFPVSAENVVYWDATSNQDAVSDISSAELRFASNGVTHVLPLELNSLVFFAQTADKQRYRPRYALTSYHQAPLAVSSGLVPAQQLVGSMGIGWMPNDDLDPQEAGRPAYATPDRQRCLAVIKAARLDTTQETNRLQAMRLCDLMTVFVRATERVPAGQGLNVSTVMRGVEQLGDTVRFASLTSGRYGVGKHCPLDRGWAMRWNPDTRYQTYTGRPATLR